jgi:prophage regulatory protein
MREILSRTGLGRTTIYKMIKDGAFPPNVSIGARSSAWLESEIEAWISARQPEEREPWTPPPPPARTMGQKRLPPLVPNEKAAEAAAKIAGVVSMTEP